MAKAIYTTDLLSWPWPSTEPSLAKSARRQFLDIITHSSAFDHHQPMIIVSHWSSSAIDHHQPLIIISHWSSSAIDHHQPLIIISHWSSSAIDHHQPLIIISHWSSSAVDHDHSIVADLGYLCYHLAVELSDFRVIFRSLSATTKPLVRATTCGA